MFSYFDKVICINLKKRNDRKNFFVEQSVKFDLGNFNFFEAIDGINVYNNYDTTLLPGELGLLLTNKEIIKEAKKENLSNILIVEDDCLFNDSILNFEDLLSYVPSDWDMIYFGGNHTSDSGVVTINEKVVKINHTFATHCVAIKSTLFDEILNLVDVYNRPIDVVYCDLQKRFNAYCYYPSVAKQKIDFSDIQNRIVDYNWLIK